MSSSARRCAHRGLPPVAIRIVRLGWPRLPTNQHDRPVWPGTDRGTRAGRRHVRQGRRDGFGHDGSFEGAYLTAVVEVKS
jgi:hypothetical protein